MEGPLGLPRPLANMEISVSTDPIDVDIQFKGPMGVSRPLARPPEERDVEEGDIQECLESKAAHEFAEGIESTSELSSTEVSNATRSWCEEILKSATEPTNDPAEILPEEFQPGNVDVDDLPDVDQTEEDDESENPLEA